METKCGENAKQGSGIQGTLIEGITEARLALRNSSCCFTFH